MRFDYYLNNMQILYIVCLTCSPPCTSISHMGPVPAGVVSWARVLNLVSPHTPLPACEGMSTSCSLPVTIISNSNTMPQCPKMEKEKDSSAKMCISWVTRVRDYAEQPDEGHQCLCSCVCRLTMEL